MALTMKMLVLLTCVLIHTAGGATVPTPSNPTETITDPPVDKAAQTGMTNETVDAIPNETLTEAFNDTNAASTGAASNTSDAQPGDISGQIGETNTTVDAILGTLTDTLNETLPALTSDTPAGNNVSDVSNISPTVDTGTANETVGEILQNNTGILNETVTAIISDTVSNETSAPPVDTPSQASMANETVDGIAGNLTGTVPDTLNASSNASQITSSIPDTDNTTGNDNGTQATDSQQSDIGTNNATNDIPGDIPLETDTNITTSDAVTTSNDTVQQNDTKGVAQSRYANETLLPSANETAPGNATDTLSGDISQDATLNDTSAQATPLVSNTTETENASAVAANETQAPVDLSPPPIDTPVVFTQDNNSTLVEITAPQFGNISFPTESPPINDSLLRKANMTGVDASETGMPLTKGNETETTIAETATNVTHSVTNDTVASGTSISVTTAALPSTEASRSKVPPAQPKLPSSRAPIEYKTELTFDHPPPIFLDGRRPPTYTEDVERFNRPFDSRPWNKPQEVKKPVITEPPPPPPIIVPRQRPTPPYRQRMPPTTTTTTTLTPLWQSFGVAKTPSPDVDPRYMTVAELAELALKNVGNIPSDKQRGLQVFFNTIHPLTPKPETTTTPSPFFKRPDVVYSPENIPGRRSLPEAKPIQEPPTQPLNAGQKVSPQLRQSFQNVQGNQRNQPFQIQSQPVKPTLNQQPQKLQRQQDQAQWQQPQQSNVGQRQPSQQQTNRGPRNLMQQQQSQGRLQPEIQQQQPKADQWEPSQQQPNQGQWQPRQQQQPPNPGQWQPKQQQPPNPGQWQPRQQPQQPQQQQQQQHQGQWQSPQQQQPNQIQWQQTQQQQQPNQGQWQPTQQQQQPPPNKIKWQPTQQQQQQPNRGQWQSTQQQQPNQGQWQSTQQQQQQQQQQPKQGQWQPTQQQQQPKQGQWQPTQQQPNQGQSQPMQQQQPNQGQWQPTQKQSNQGQWQPTQQQQQQQPNQGQWQPTQQQPNQGQWQPTHQQQQQQPNQGQWQPTQQQQKPNQGQWQPTQQQQQQHQQQQPNQGPWQPTQQEQPNQQGQWQPPQKHQQKLQQNTQILPSADDQFSNQLQQQRPSTLETSTTKEGSFTPFVNTNDLYLAQALEAWIKSMKPEIEQQVRNLNMIDNEPKKLVKQKPFTTTPRKITEKSNILPQQNMGSTITQPKPNIDSRMSQHSNKRPDLRSNNFVETRPVAPKTNIKRNTRVRSSRPTQHATRNNFGLVRPREHVYGSAAGQPLHGILPVGNTNTRQVIPERTTVNHNTNPALPVRNTNRRQVMPAGTIVSDNTNPALPDRNTNNVMPERTTVNHNTNPALPARNTNNVMPERTTVQKDANPFNHFRAPVRQPSNGMPSATRTVNDRNGINQPTGQLGNPNTNANNVFQQFPLAQQMGVDAILPSSSLNINDVTSQFNFQPNIITDVGARTHIIPARTIAETGSHWSSKAGNSIKLPSEHVPYFMRPNVNENTGVQPRQEPITTTSVPVTARNIYPTTTRYRPVRRRTYTTTTAQPTIPPTADPNPPPIFDTKVLQTFMPFPKPDETTRPTVNNSSNQGHDGSGTGDTNNDMAGFDKRCTGCVFVNDRCLLPDGVHCNMFVECVRQGSLVRAFNRECALGSFFDRKSFLCVDPKNTDCPQDRCREPGLKWYPIHGHCKHYWSCASREGGGIYAQSECCPDMGGFVEGAGCVADKNCTESCDSKIVTGATTGCHLRKTASPTVYFDANANIQRPCAPGTLFNEQKCTCEQDVTIERSGNRPGAQSCSPMLELTFSNDTVVDTSNNKQHVGIEGIATTRTGQGLFNGAGKLILWRYANLMFPVVFAVRFRFLSTSSGPRYQTVISNCDPKGGREPTFDITLDTLYHEVIFKVDTLESLPRVFKQIYQHGKWTSVVLIYDGERVVGSVDSRARNIIAHGGIETRPNPINIGACGRQEGLSGLLDDLTIYEECIPDDMYGIFMSVLE